jgi:hypothetical protein
MCNSNSSATIQNRKILCPSTPAKEGAVLLGIVDKDGTLAYIPDKMEIDSGFIEIAEKGRALEKRFRFSNKCAGKGCQNWIQGNCIVPKVMSQLIKTEIEFFSLPSCSIRNDCRWYLQEGASACGICPFVRTENLEDLIKES